MIEENVNNDAALRFLFELSKRQAHLVAHGSRSLLHHLRGCYELLLQWGVPESVSLAGLCHSVYGTPGFREPLFATEERELVRSLIGKDAEQLVWLYASSTLTGVIEQIEGLKSAGEIVGSQLRAIALIHAANLAEQAAEDDGSPSRWLSTWSRLMRLLDTRNSMNLRVFDVHPQLEDGLLGAYFSVFQSRSDADFEAFVSLVERHYSVLPGDICVVAAFLAFQLGRSRTAGLLSQAALSAFNETALIYDKRLAGKQWLALGESLAVICSMHPRELEFIRFVTQRVLTEPWSPPHLYAQFSRLDLLASTDRGDDELSLPKAFQVYIRSLLSSKARAVYPGLPSNKWYTADVTPLAKALEDNFESILDEVTALERHHFHAESEAISRSGSWDVFMLNERGVPREDNCAFVPVLSRILSQHRVVNSVSGLCYLSRLAAHTSIEPHRGPTNMRLRLHLGIVCPEDCGIMVGDEVRTWSAGKCLVFDDSFEHAAWNRSTQDRLVLVVDIWHPALTDEEVALINALDRFALSRAQGLERYFSRNEISRANVAFR